MQKMREIAFAVDICGMSLLWISIVFAVCQKSQQRGTKKCKRSGSMLSLFHTYVKYEFYHQNLQISLDFKVDCIFFSPENFVALFVSYIRKFDNIAPRCFQRRKEFCETIFQIDLVFEKIF